MNIENNGERVDINFYDYDIKKFDKYQLSHFHRYNFVREYIKSSNIPAWCIGDMACGSGYGSMLLLNGRNKVHGLDISSEAIEEISKRYSSEKFVSFFRQDLLTLNLWKLYDLIVSFETIEHLERGDIDKVLDNMHQALVDDGILIFSTPYDQEDSPQSRLHHKTFHIKEDTIKEFLKDKFEIIGTYYQNYEVHTPKEYLEEKKFIITIARKI